MRKRQPPQSPLSGGLHATKRRVELTMNMIPHSPDKAGQKSKIQRDTPRQPKPLAHPLIVLSRVILEPLQGRLIGEAL